MLGNILYLDPDLLDAWLKERLLPLHPAIDLMPIVPQARLDEIKAENEAIHRELVNVFNDANVLE